MRPVRMFTDNVYEVHTFVICILQVLGEKCCD